MKKFYSTLLATLCAAGMAMAGPADGLSGRSVNLNVEKQLRTEASIEKKIASVNSIEAQGAIRTDKAMPEGKIVRNMYKAGSNNSIEGTWLFNLGDYYFQSSVFGTIQVEFVATLDGDVVWFEDPTGQELPIVAEFNSKTNELSFEKYYLGDSGYYYIYQEPFIWANDLIEVDAIIGTFNGKNEISFEPDNGLMWTAYADMAGTNALGYFAIYDMEGAQKQAPWIAMENGKFNENVIYGTFQGTQNTVVSDVEVYCDPTTPGIYKVINPFGQLYSELGFTNDSPSMIIDATNPDNVLIEMQSTGISGGSAGVYYYFNEGWYCEQFGDYLDPALICTMTVEDNVVTISIPYHSITVYASGSGGFYYGSAYPSELTFTVPAPELAFDDFEMELLYGATEPTTVDVPVNILTGLPIEYRGFQFDITLPEGLSIPEEDGVALNSALPGNVNYGLLPVGTENNNPANTYRIVADFTGSVNGLPTSYNILQDIVTLTISASYGNIDPDEYPVTISNVVFSTNLGSDIEGVGSTGTVTILAPATEIAIETITLMAPSYDFRTNPPFNVNHEMYTNIVAGQSVEVTVTVQPDNSTDVPTLVTSIDGVAGEPIELTPVEGKKGVYVATVETAPNANNTAFEVDLNAAVEERDIEATQTLNVAAVDPGNSNNNAGVNVADVVTTANYVAVTMTPDLEGEALAEALEPHIMVFCWPNANVVDDETIDVNDITATVNIALGRDVDFGMSARRVASDDFIALDNFNVTEGQEMIIGANLNNSFSYAALQGSIIVPEGMEIINVVQGPRAAGHDIVVNKTDDGRVNIVLYSLTNASFSDVEGSLFNIIAVASQNCGNLSMEDIQASDANSRGYELSYVGGENQSIATGVTDIEAAAEGEVRYYNLQGVEVKNPVEGTILIRVEGNKATKVVK